MYGRYFHEYSNPFNKRSYLESLERDRELKENLEEIRRKTANMRSFYDYLSKQSGIAALDLMLADQELSERAEAALASMKQENIHCPFSAEASKYTGFLRYLEGRLGAAAIENADGIADFEEPCASDSEPLTCLDPARTGELVDSANTKSAACDFPIRGIFPMPRLRNPD